jgi:hypothetical protein
MISIWNVLETDSSKDKSIRYIYNALHVAGHISSASSFLTQIFKNIETYKKAYYRNIISNMIYIAVLFLIKIFVSLIVFFRV